jgi:hypothetical protein
MPMVHVNYPRINLNAHSDLVAWRGKNPKNEGDWTSLKEFLAEQPRINNEHRIPKCWYSELPQGDNYALDVEHFRPKNQAKPLNPVQLQKLEKTVGYSIYQDITEGQYPWLEFDYRNYRLTTALPNRGGAKHVFFPIIKSSSRLVSPQLPWVNTEYNLLLDPADPHDAQQLVVLPNGQIVPRAPRTALNDLDFTNYQANWQADGFNFLRASVTILLYRLEDKIFVQAREEKFKEVQEDCLILLNVMKTNADQSLLNIIIERLFIKLLPSAPFALAARSALQAYISPDPNQRATLKTLVDTLMTRIDALSAANQKNWNNP